MTPKYPGYIGPIATIWVPGASPNLSQTELYALIQAIDRGEIPPKLGITWPERVIEEWIREHNPDLVQYPKAEGARKEDLLILAEVDGDEAISFHCLLNPSTTSVKALLSHLEGRQLWTDPELALYGLTPPEGVSPFPDQFGVDVTETPDGIITNLAYSRL